MPVELFIDHVLSRSLHINETDIFQVSNRLIKMIDLHLIMIFVIKHMYTSISQRLTEGT
jgi:hypothetical protein